VKRGNVLPKVKMIDLTMIEYGDRVQELLGIVPNTVPVDEPGNVPGETPVMVSMVMPVELPLGKSVEELVEVPVQTPVVVPVNIPEVEHVEVSSVVPANAPEKAHSRSDLDVVQMDINEAFLLARSRLNDLKDTIERSKELKFPPSEIKRRVI